MQSAPDKSVRQAVNWFNQLQSGDNESEVQSLSTNLISTLKDSFTNKIMIQVLQKKDQSFGAYLFLLVDEI